MNRNLVIQPVFRNFMVSLVGASLLAAVPVSAAGVFYVNNSGGSCSDAGPGTEAAPYCTISAAVLAHNGAGTTIYVKPGTYPEQITVPLSGTAGSPFVIQALGGPVIVDGAEDLSVPEAWVQYSGDVYLAAIVDWALSQAFIDGARLSPYAGDPAFVPPNSFIWVSGQGLFVNAGGDNPGSHKLLVGKRPYGFLAAARNYVTIDGFTVTHAENRGIQLNNDCTNVTVSHNTVTFSSRYGIQAVGGSNILIDGNVVSDNGDHGIMFLNGVASSTIQNNESFRNARPDERAANGINLFNCPGDLLQGNRTHDNQDSGIQLDLGSNGCLVRQNMSWHNGDHGFDDINSTGVTYIGDDAFGNFRDGFSFDGTSPNAHIENCIAAENGLISQRFDLWVSIASADSFTSDYNIFWNSTSQPIIKHVTTQYVSLPVFSATTGQDTHSIQFDPAFMNPWAGDFRLVSGSIAIDNGDADAPGWADRDAAGKPRVDDPSSPNLGVGPIAYGDRGALEFPATQVVVRPLASMVVTPNIGSEPLPVTVDASGSSDTGGGIVTYTFDFGDGTTQGPQASAFATHTYAAGNWTMTLTVTNQEGAARATWVLVLVGSSSPPNLVLNSSFEQDLSGWAPYGAAVLALVPGGYDGVQSVQMTGTATDYAVFGINDHNNWVHSVPVIGTHYRFSAWVMSPSSTGQAKLSVSEFVLTTGEQVGSAISTGVTLSPAWQQITMDYIAARQGTTLDFHVRDDPVAIGEVFQTDAIVINDLGPTVTGVGSPAASSSLAPMLYPSPLRTTSTLRFATSRPGRLRVEILDLAGRRVRQLIDEPQAATGVHQLSVSRGAGRDGPALGPGVYFYRVADVDGIRSGRFVVLC